MSEVFKSEESNYTVTYGSTNITAYVTQSDLEALVKETDATNLASAGAESAPGSTDWTLRASGLLSKAVDDVLGLDALGPPGTLRDLVVTIGPTGSMVTRTWTGSTTEGAFVKSYTIQSTEPTQLIPFQSEIGISGGPVRS